MDQWAIRASSDTSDAASIIVGLDVVAVGHHGAFIGEEDTCSLRTGAAIEVYECEGFYCDCRVGSLQSISVPGSATIFLSFLVRGCLGLIKAFGVASIVACCCRLIFFKLYLNLREVIRSRRVWC